MDEASQELIKQLESTSESDIVEDWIVENVIKPSIKKGEMGSLDIVPANDGSPVIGEFLYDMPLNLSPGFEESTRSELYSLFCQLKAANCKIFK